MTDLAIVLSAAVITFACRASFLVKPRPAPTGALARFLEVFPLALFVAIATNSLAAPDGAVAMSPALAGAAGGVLGGVVFRRSRRAVLSVGAAAFYIVRAMVG